MELLFKRQQTSGTANRVKFKLWGKVEFDEHEKAIVKRYRFDDAIMIAVIQPALIRNTLIVAACVFVVLQLILLTTFSFTVAFAFSAIFGAGAGYWFFHEKRETIFVRDLIHGRHFICDSVVELARKEAWLETVSAYLRQVMESAKYWNGTARLPIEPLPKDEARRVILRGL